MPKKFNISQTFTDDIERLMKATIPMMFQIANDEVERNQAALEEKDHRIKLLMMQASCIVMSTLTTLSQSTEVDVDSIDFAIDEIETLCHQKCFKMLVEGAI